MSDIISQNNNTSENSIDNEDELHIASQGLRLINYLIDSVFCFMIMMLFMPEGSLEKAHRNIAWNIELSILSIAVSFVYYFVSESLWGVTIGKIFTKTRTVDDYNDKPSVKAVFIRSLCRIIPFEIISFLFKPIGLHDSLSKTYVVKARKSI